MIQEFSLTNFLSFNDKQTINLLASSDKKHLDELTYEPKKGVKILKLLMIYGANASGKSNLLNAIQILWMLLISPKEKENSKISFYNPFKLNIDKPIEFEIIFWVDDRKFKYEIKYNEYEILFEKLEYVTDSGVMSDLYEREIGKDIKFGSTIAINTKVKNDFNTNTLKNHTVLSTLNKKNIDAPKILIELYEWIKNSVHELGSHNNAIKIVEYANKDAKIKEFLLGLLCRADFNIIDFNVVESKMNESLLEEILKDDSLSQSLKDKLLKPQKQLLFTHKNDDDEFQIEFGMQSSGTRVYFRLARLLIELGNHGTIALEDELEDSLHYDLLLHFLETFLRYEKNSQLIFTTHNQMLLDEDWMLRRDMICFIEKSRNKSNSEIYKASDLGLHKNLSLLNAYKIGKLGAKPNLGSTMLNQL
ncbi:AAA family ATPase [Tenacibaculum finnmarkense]|uniref:AAA family ATPase n=1 Tax=Tenacibaculum finnmarkense TaxID=2781243 RepID=UPI001E3A558B|nr:ATP-binding protein [Tenacibaculum finnmarkense]MCD8409716.1 ATP-binding protein [Tenacibaculum finnmarkense genomovar ulcerans]